jgi:hypothetical protein
MKISYVGLDQRITAAKTARRKRPRIRFENVLAFPLVQLFLGRQIGNEFCLLVGRQRRIADSACLPQIVGGWFSGVKFPNFMNSISQCEMWSGSHQAWNVLPLRPRVFSVIYFVCTWKNYVNPS